MNETIPNDRRAGSFDPFEVSDPISPAESSQPSLPYLPFSIAVAQEAPEAVEDVDPIEAVFAVPLPTLNYYNYFSEIEAEFVKRRGSHLYVSSLDWALIQTWKDMDVPLHIVIRGINQSFDLYDKRTLKTRKVNSLFYCMQEVETCFAEFRESQVGAPAQPQVAAPAAQPAAGGASDGFSQQIILSFLSENLAKLTRAHQTAATGGNQRLSETLDRVVTRLTEIVAALTANPLVDNEGLERDLTSLEDLLLETIQQTLAAEMRQAIEEEGKSQLKAYKKNMPKATYEQTLANYIAKRLREMNGIPRLSLFYLF